MRDPARIDRILALLEVYWKKYPDLRLGQIVCSMHARYGEKIDPQSPPSVFSLEDDHYEAMLTKELGLLTALAAVAQGPSTKERRRGCQVAQVARDLARLIFRRGKA